MRIYVASLLAGLVVGIIYALIDVRSPAPPIVALVGLLGMLTGEESVAIARRVIAGESLRSAWTKEEAPSSRERATVNRDADKE
jgi:XapX domain-containing protein